MTQVTVNTSSAHTTLNITQLEHGVWYKIVEYIHNKSLVGQIGICVETYFSKGAIDKTLVSPDGSRFSHEELKFIKIENITISY